MIKIAILGSYPPQRGISSYCYEFSKAMAERHPVEFISFRSMYPAFLYPGRDLEEDHTFTPFKHPQLTVRRRLTWYNPLSWLFEGFSISPSLLHIQWWSLPLAPIYITLALIFKCWGKPVVMTIHNVKPHEDSALFVNTAKLLFALGDHFIVHTRQNQRLLTAIYHIREHRISVIPHGTLPFDSTADPDRDAIRKNLGFQEDQQVVLLFGAVRPYKGIDTAIEALARLKDHLPGVRLLIVGKLWEAFAPYQALIDRFQIQDRVITRLAYINTNEVYQYFAAADLAILPYHHFDSQTGVGSAVIAARKPLIVSDVGGLPDLVKDRRYVVPPQDPAALARAMQYCLSEPSRLAAMARDADDVAETLSWRTIAFKTSRVYQKCLATRAAR